jgi:hypothetical protein
MEEIVQELKEIEGIKSVRTQGENVLKIKPFSRERKGQEEEKIMGDLRKITPKISNTLDRIDSVDSWEWNVRPKKRYAETGISDSVNDRKPKGHKPAHYLVTIHRDD